MDRRISLPLKGHVLDERIGHVPESDSGSETFDSPVADRHAVMTGIADSNCVCAPGEAMSV
jgi:hypothetical protein